MTDQATAEEPRVGVAVLPAPLLLLCGVVIVPMLLGVAFNSYSAPDAAAYIRIAFASVAGMTISLIVVLALLVDRLIHRAPASGVAIAAFVVTLSVLSGFSNVADNLMRNLANLN
jgi:hypothetical protein